MIKLILDTLGSDNGLTEQIEGAVNALNKYSNLYLIICGPKNKIEDILKTKKILNNNYEILDANDTITNDDTPTIAIKTKKDSSLVKALDLMNEDDSIKGLISTGSTGAVLCGAIMKLKRIARIRPTLGTLLPNDNGSYFFLTDCGANVDCRPEHLVDFAKMGCAFVQSYLNITNPRVGLLSNGSEDKKGNNLTKEVFPLLNDFNFVGNIEGNKVLNDLCDVLVCDGFVGNVVLKNIEGGAKTIIKELVIMLKSSNDSNEQKVIKNAINKIMQKYDFNSLGGAVILGINKVIVKGHGSANNITILNCIAQALKLVENDVVANINKYF